MNYVMKSTVIEAQFKVEDRENSLTYDLQIFK